MKAIYRSKDALRELNAPLLHQHIYGNLWRKLNLASNSKKCKLYLRYIDDIFFIRIETLQELNKFTLEINQVHQLIKFDFNYSKIK